MSSARFKLRNQTTNGAWSPFSDGDFEASGGDVIECRLEDTPALDIWQTIVSCIDRSDGRTQVTLDPVDGTLQAPDDAPTDIVEITLPAEVGTWEIQVMTNGGVAVFDAAGRADETINTKTREIIVRTENLDLAHPLADDLAKDPDKAAVRLQEMIDAVDAGAGGGATPTLSAAMTPDVGGTPVLGVWFMGERTKDAFVVEANSLRLLMPMFGLATSDTDFLTVTVAWFEEDGTEHDIAVATTEDTTGMGTTGNAFLPGGPIVERVQYPITHAGTTIDANGVLGILCEVGGGTPGPAWFCAYL